MNTETFGQIEAVRRWLAEESVEYFCDGNWHKIKNRKDWTWDNLPVFFRYSKFRLVQPAAFPAPPEGEKTYRTREPLPVKAVEKEQTCNNCREVDCAFRSKIMEGCEYFKPIFKAMVEFGPEDVPPGSVFQKTSWEKICWIAPQSVGEKGVVVASKFITFRELQYEKWRILRPGEDWKLCEKELK